MENIYLIGFMGTGKSTVARLLSDKKHMKHIEMDDRLVEEAGMSINDIFAQKGEEYFRNMETDLIRRLSDQGGCVVSCGGGVPMRTENVEAMRKGGCVVYLASTPETIYERVRHATHRPLLNGHMNVAYIKELMEVRLPYYEAAADLTINTSGKTSEDVCKEIIDKLN